MNSVASFSQESGTRGQSMNIHHGISQSPANNDSVGAFHGQVSSTTDSTETGSKPCFSFSQKPSETSAIQQDIQQYIKKFEKNVKTSTVRSNYCEPLEYSFQSSTESLLIDRVLLKSRIDSGNLLLCGGGNKLLSKFYGRGI